MEGERKRARIWCFRLLDRERKAMKRGRETARERKREIWSKVQFFVSRVWALGCRSARQRIA